MVNFYDRHRFISKRKLAEFAGVSPRTFSRYLATRRHILDAMGIRRVEIEGFEADDIIGTIARAAEDSGLEPYIITGDKDQLQLVTDVTKVVFTKKGVSELRLYADVKPEEETAGTVTETDITVTEAESTDEKTQKNNKNVLPYIIGVVCAAAAAAGIIAAVTVIKRRKRQ